MSRLLILIGIFILPASPGMSQTIDRSQTGTGLFDGISKVLGGFGLLDIVLLVVGLVLGVFGDRIVLYLRKRFNSPEPRLASKALAHVDYTQMKGHKALIVGLGGTGKSSLIESLIGYGKGARAKTGKPKYTAFPVKFEVTEKSTPPRGFLLSVADYYGQEPGTLPGLIKHFTFDGQTPISAIILVVDLSKAGSSADEDRIKHPDIVSGRVKEHNNAWGNDTFLETIKGIDGASRPKLFLTVINAVDCIERYSDAVSNNALSDKDKDEIKAHFKTTRAKASKVWGDCVYETVVGSVKSADTVEEIRCILQKTAIRKGAG